MKRMLSLLLLLSLFLSGCSIWGDRIKEPVTFYYLRSEYQYGTEDSVLASEEREASGHRHDLPYLLALYCMGPSEEGLRSPLPTGIRVEAAEIQGSQILLTLSDTTESLTDTNYTLACACLTLTCLELTGAEEVTITSGTRSVTMRRDSLILLDGSHAAETETIQ